MAQLSIDQTNNIGADTTAAAAAQAAAQRDAADLQAQAQAFVVGAHGARNVGDFGGPEKGDAADVEAIQ